ncbi:MAG: glycoside hydrolase family 3 protein [Lachnospiraceae bacterium]|nr:glycoside hydrolase family 3 protein [Lachnospiraceae bacterium]
MAKKDKSEKIAKRIERKQRRRENREKHKKIRIILAVAYALLFIVGAYALLSVFVFDKIKENKQAELEAEQAQGSDVIEVNDNTESVIPISKEELKAKQEAEKEVETVSEDEAPVEETEIEQKAGQLLAQMNLDEKIYQMIILTPEQLVGEDDITAAGAKTKEGLEKYPVGGIVYSSSNLKDPEQTKTMLKNMDEYGLKTEGIPLFLCVAEEGGNAAPIAGTKAFKAKGVSAMGSIGSADDAYAAGHTIGESLWGLGFNVNLAPDCDVNTAEGGSFIGSRSFGSDPVSVREYAASYSNGLHDSVILSTFKYFPGYGSVPGDPKDGAVSTDKTLDQLKEAELVPFAYAPSAGADFVMVGHVSVPSILNNDTPSSLSHEMVTDVLKGELAYEGIVVTDALNKKAVTDTCDSASAAVLAIRAGNDMLLTPDDHASIPEKVKEAMEAGDITEEQIDASVKKILVKKLVMNEARAKRIKEDKERKEKEEKEKQEQKNKKKKKKN